MDLKQLRALLVVAEVGSVTRAAEILNIVQPAVSRQLQLLEEDLGAPLFARSRQGMVLTDEGRILTEYARRAIHELERARAEIQPSGVVRGIVTLGLLPSTVELLCSPLLSAVKRDYPEITLRFSTGYAVYLHQWLDNGEVDASLLYDAQPSTTIETKPLLEETLWLVGQPAAGLKGDQPVSLAQYDQQPFVLPSAPHGLRSLVDGACASAGVTLNVFAETNSMRVQRSLVMGGHGYTILPEISVASDIARGLLSGAPLQDAGLMRKIVLATPTTRRVTPATRHVLTALEHVMREVILQDQWREARWLLKP